MTVLTALITVFIKPLLLIAGIFMQQKVDENNSAALNHLYLFFCVLSIPLLVLGWYFGEWISIPIGQASGLLVDRLTDFLQTSMGSLLFVVYVGVFFLILFYRLLGVIALWQQRSFYQRPPTSIQQQVASIQDSLALKNSVHVYVSEKAKAPYVWGILRHDLVLPVDMAVFAKGGLVPVLLHEFAHIQRRDWLVSQIMLVICALFWFLPPVWWLLKRAENLAELACDDRVIVLCDQNPEYAEILVALGRAGSEQRKDLPTADIVGGSIYYQRILRLFDQYQNRDVIYRRDTLTTALLLTLWVLPLLVVGVNVSTSNNTVSQYIEIMLATHEPLISSNETLVETHRYYMPARPVAMASLPAPDSKILLPVLSTPIEEVGVLAEHPVIDKSTLEPAVAVSIQGYLPIRLVTPTYPRRAIRRSIEGEVSVQFSITAEGRVSNPAIVQAQPQGYFEQAVLSALDEFEFIPYRINGEAVAVHNIHERFVFRLSNQVPEPSLASKKRSLSPTAALAALATGPP